jgi:pyruvate dehydrogenase (quinone)
MSQTVGDFLVERLYAWGVRVIFGYPGDGINGVFGALNRAGGKIRFVQARTALGGHYQQKVDLPSLFKDVAGAFTQQASSPSQVRHLVDRAIRTALGERRVTAIILPNDLQEAEYTEPARAHGTLHSGIGYSRPKTIPYESDLRRAADVLNSGKKVAMLVGAGALEATDEVSSLACAVPRLQHLEWFHDHVSIIAQASPAPRLQIVHIGV